MKQNAELIMQDVGRRVAGRRVAGHVITDRRIADRRIGERRNQNTENNTQYTGVERRVAERRISDRRTQNADLRMEYAELSGQYLPKNAEISTHSPEHSTHHAVRSKPSYMAWGILALMVVLAGVGAYIVKSSLSDDSPRKKNSPVMITLLKPPPPPQIKEKPPEPVKELPKEEIYTPEQSQDSNPGSDDDKTPAGDNLGVDAEGTAGGDAFGLVGKKGGRSILAGDGGSGGMGRLSLLVKFAGYAHIAEAEIRKMVMKHLDENGGIPKGKLQAGVRLRVDSSGAIVDFKIIGSSGNHKMDDAVKQALSDTKLSEPPPDGMPRTMVIKITSQG